MLAVYIGWTARQNNQKNCGHDRMVSKRGSRGVSLALTGFCFHWFAGNLAPEKSTLPGHFKEIFRTAQPASLFFCQTLIAALCAGNQASVDTKSAFQPVHKFEFAIAQTGPDHP